MYKASLYTLFLKEKFESALCHKLPLVFKCILLTQMV